MIHIGGAFVGFLAGAFLADAIGRKRTFIVSALGSVICVAIYLAAPIGNGLMLLLGGALACWRGRERLLLDLVKVALRPQTWWETHTGDRKE